jgi:putative transposase
MHPWKAGHLETVRKTHKEQLRPTAAQARQREEVLWRCRMLSNTALAQRLTAWERCHVSITRSQQEAELTAIRADLPEDAALPSQLLHDVLARLDRTAHAAFRRLATGDWRAARRPALSRAESLPLLHLPAPPRTTATAPEDGNGARLENGSLVLAKSGRIAGRWSRPIEGTIKTVTLAREADGG